MKENSAQDASKQKRFKLKYVLFSLIPVILLLVVAEALACIVYYQQRGHSSLALLSAIDLVKKKATGEEIDEVASRRYVRLTEQVRLSDHDMIPSAGYLAMNDQPLKERYPFHTDSNGFVVPSKIHENPDLTIVFQGGSTTECMFMEEKNRFPYKVGRILEEKTGKKVNTYNSGVSGISSMNSFGVLVNKLVPMKPDYVVLMHAINDMNVLLHEDTYWNDHPYRSLVVDPDNPRFFDGRYANDEWLSTRDKILTIDTNKIVVPFRQSLESFISVTRIWGIEPVLMTQANRFTEVPNLNILGEAIEAWKKNGLEYAQIKILYDRMNEVVREVARQKGVLLIDLAAKVPQESEYLEDIVHYTDKGSLFAADIISSALLSSPGFLSERAHHGEEENHSLSIQSKAENTHRKH
jgi:hypothetical protein